MKSRRGPLVSEADVQIFRDAIGTVRPLRRGNTSPLPRARPRPGLLRSAPRDDLPLEELLGSGAAAGHASLAGPLHFLLPGLERTTLQRLKRGAYLPQDELDLHHMSAATARQCLLHFLEEACHAGFRCVRVIHGKGLGSPMGGPVLKVLTDRLLRGHDQVLAFSSARPEQGGTGAVLVLLRRQ